jgi:hypothetical protein
MLADLRVDELAAMRLEALVGAFLVSPHQPRIARYIGGEDRGETVGLANDARWRVRKEGLQCSRRIARPTRSPPALRN